MAPTCSAIVKKSRKPLTLNQKLEMIKLSELGMLNAEIGRKLGLARQTVSSIVNSKEKFLKEIKSATPVNTKVIRKRDGLIADMEKVLAIWIEDQTRHNVPPSQALIQNKALTLFDYMKAERGEAAVGERFGASRGWFVRFMKRSDLRNVRVQGEASSCDAEAARSYSNELAKIIDEGGYTDQQIFNVDETSLYWKKMLSSTFIAREEMSVSGFKASKDRLTLLLGANAAGDCKLKPMLIFHSDNPRALKNYAKASLPVYYKSNSKAWMTADLFTTWFTEYFKPTVEAYCLVKQIPFKILLISDNAPGHPRALMEMYEEINVIFLPNATSIQQPMDRGVIAAFKSYYLRRIFVNALAAVDSDASDGTRQSKLRALWKGYTILDAIKNIRDSWDDVKTSTLIAVWKELLPAHMIDFEGFDTSVEEATANVVEMASELEMDAEPGDVVEWLASHDQLLTDEDLLLSDEQRLLVEMESTPDEDPASIAEMKMKDLEHYVGLLDTVVAGFERIDPNFQRSSAVGKILSNGIACYREIIHERKRRPMRQTSKTKQEKYFKFGT